MFIQVIQGRTTRAAELRPLAESWRDGDGSGAVGWLGGTFGVTDDGDFLGVIRFSSREDARANSERPETGAFAQKMAALMDGAVLFHDCDDVTEVMGGGSDDAGFVQVISGHVDDPGRAKAMLADTDDLQRMRPEIIGGTFALASDGTFFETIYFTDEQSARSGEAVAPPAEVAAELEWMMSGATYYDLHAPWFESR